jgi:hypothetical protein
LNTSEPYFQKHKLDERRKLELATDEDSQSSSANRINSTSWYSGYDITSLNHTSTYFLPFIPMKYNLDKSTIALNVSHPQSGYTQYNTHSLSGHMMAKRIQQALDSPSFQDLQGKLKLISSKSTFAGTGQIGQHWFSLPSNASYSDLRYSIAHVMNM